MINCLTSLTLYFTQCLQDGCWVYVEFSPSETSRGEHTVLSECSYVQARELLRSENGHSGSGLWWSKIVSNLQNNLQV